ncbi:amiloride-sensitive sodium channel subunit alpha-like, partial [Paramuricea clavata]
MEEKKKPSFRGILVEFMGYTTGHGFGRLVEATTFVWRIFWILAILGASGMFAMEVTNLFKLYLSRPVQTSVTITFEKQLNFPAVTICNLNIIKRSSMTYLPDKVKEHFKLNYTYYNYVEDKKDTTTNSSISEKPTEAFKATEKPNQVVSKTEKPNVVVNGTGTPTEAIKITDKPNQDVSTTEKPNVVVNGTGTPTEAIKTTEKPNVVVDSTETPTEAVNVTEKPTTGLTTTGEPTKDLGTTSKPKGKERRKQDFNFEVEYLAKEKVSFFLYTSYEKNVDKETKLRMKVESYIGGESPEFLTGLGHKRFDLIRKCTWRGVDCIQGNLSVFWKWSWNYKYGNCYTFNDGIDDDKQPLRILKSSKPGPSQGLVLQLAIEEDEYLGELTEEAGVRVLLHEPGAMPFPFEEGFSIAPGMATSIGLTKTLIKRLDRFENGSCSEDDVSLREDNLYRKHKNITRYSLQQHKHVSTLKGVRIHVSDIAKDQLYYTIIKAPNSQPNVLSERQTQLNFPAVTICNLNMIKNSSVVMYLPDELIQRFTLSETVTYYEEITEKPNEVANITEKSSEAVNITEKPTADNNKTEQPTAHTSIAHAPQSRRRKKREEPTEDGYNDDDRENGNEDVHFSGEKDVDGDIVDKEGVDGDTVDKEGVDGDTVDKEGVDGGTVDKEGVDGDTVDEEGVDGGTVDKEGVDGGTVDKEDVDDYSVHEVDEDISDEYPEEEIVNPEEELRRELNSHIGTYKRTEELHKLGHKRYNLIQDCTWKSTDCRKG